MRRHFVAASLSLGLAGSALALSDKDANELAAKTLSSNIVTKAAIGQLLFEGLLHPQPGTLEEIVARQGGLRAKTAYRYLRMMKVVPASYGQETVPPPLGSSTRVSTKVELPEGVGGASLRAAVTGWGWHYGAPPTVPVAADGSVTVPTGVNGDGFLVVRGPSVDIAYGGDVNRIRHLAARPYTPLQKSRMEIKPGQDIALDFLYPFTGTSDWGFPNLVDPKAVRVERKTPGKAKLVFFAENSRHLSTTLVDPAQPIGRVEVVGDFNNWTTDAHAGTAKELFDDGGMVEEGSTDAVVGDGVFTRTLELPRGTHAYAFLINGTPNLVRDPYEEGSKVVEVKTQLGKFKVRVSTITVE